MEQWQGNCPPDRWEILSVWLHHHHYSRCISIISPIRHIYSNIKRERKGYITFLMYYIYYMPMPITAQMMPDKAGCGDRGKVILSVSNGPTTSPCDGRDQHHYQHPHFIEENTEAQRTEMICPRCPPSWTSGGRTWPQTFWFHIPWDPYITDVSGDVFIHPSFIDSFNIYWVRTYCGLNVRCCEDIVKETTYTPWSEGPEQGSCPGWFSPGNIAQSLETFSVVTMRRMLLSSPVLMPHKLPNTLQYTGQPHNKELSIPKCQ